MTQLVEFPLEDGSTILIEIDELVAADGLVPASRGEKVIQQANQTFEKAMNVIKPAATAIIDKVRGLHDPPDEIEVEFGLKVSAHAGAYVAKLGAEANYKVTLKWSREASR